MDQLILASLLSFGATLGALGFVKWLIHFYGQRINKKHLKDWYSTTKSKQCLGQVKPLILIFFSAMILLLAAIFAYLLFNGYKELVPIIHGEQIEGQIVKHKKYSRGKGKVNGYTVELENGAIAFFYTPELFRVGDKDQFFWSELAPKKVLPNHFVRNWIVLLFVIPIFVMTFAILGIQLNLWLKASQILKKGRSYKVPIENAFSYTVKGKTTTRVFFHLPSDLSEIAYADLHLSPVPDNLDDLKTKTITLWTLDRKTWAHPPVTKI